MFEPVESSILLRRTEEFFGPATPLVRAPEVGGRAYEPRPQQVAMAVRVATCLAAGRHLCIEAPTGVGKTFAYLVPAALLALEHKRPVVVSTHTISLQEQIMRKDAPILQKLMGVEFKVVLAKGRGNYLCLRRLFAAAGNHQEYLPSAELLPELARLQEWSQETRDGSRSE
jgi:ATP-dependent DNA helicase DinG